MLRVLLVALVCAVAIASGVWLYNSGHTADAAVRSNDKMRETVARLEQRLDGLGDGQGGIDREIAAALIQWSDTIRAQGERTEAFRAAINDRLSALEAGFDQLAPGAVARVRASPDTSQAIDPHLSTLETQLDLLTRSVQTVSDIAVGLDARLNAFSAEVEQVTASDPAPLQLSPDFEQSIGTRFSTLETQLDQLAKTAQTATDIAAGLDTRLDAFAATIGQQLASNPAPLQLSPDFEQTIDRRLTSLETRLDQLQAGMATSADIDALLERNAIALKETFLASAASSPMLTDGAEAQTLPDQLVVPSEN